MSKVHETRQSIDHQLDVWETKAAALEAQINLNREKGAARLQAAKQDLRNKLDAFKNQLENVPTLAEEKKQAVMDKLENLQVQLALGKAEAKDSYEEQKKKIQGAVQAFEEEIDARLDEADQKIVAALDTMNGELEAFSIQFEHKKGEAEAAFDAKKREAIERLNTFRADIKAKRETVKATIEKKQETVKEKAKRFESDLASAFKKIRDAFTHLAD